MIPLALHLTNFLSYRQTAVLDFDGVNLACISGPNGAGKSSLLDGITWALFGESRGPNDDDVVHRLAQQRGETAEAVFIFALGPNRYRVARRKKAGGRMLLEFQIGSAEGGWITLSETKLRETQERIEQTLGMKYETFTNVSFFLQGKADTFTTQTANKRKELLAELLGVNRWDALKERTVERRKAAEKDRELTDARLRDIEEELGQTEARETDLRLARAEHERAAAQLQAQEELVRNLQRVAEDVARQQAALARLAEQHTRLKASAVELEQRQATRRRERDAHQRLLDRRAAVEQAHADYLAAQEALEAWQGKAEQFQALQQAARPHELALARLRSALQEQQRALLAQQQRVEGMRTERTAVEATAAEAQATLTAEQSRLHDLEAQEAALQRARERRQTLEGQRKLWEQEAAQLRKTAETIASREREREQQQTALETAAAALAQLTAQTAELDALRDPLAQAQADIKAIDEVQKQRKAQMEKLDEQIKRLQAGAGGACPHCGQLLTEEHCARMTAELTREGSALADLYRADKQRLADLRAQVARWGEALAHLPKLERERPQRQQAVADATARLAQIDRDCAEWQTTGGAERLAAVQAHLADDAEWQALQTELAGLASVPQHKQAAQRAVQQAQQRLAQAEARLAEIARALDEWETQQAAQLESVSRQLAAEAFGRDEREALAALQAQAQAVGYDADAHAVARERREELKDAPQQLQALRAAEAAVKPLDDALADLADQAAEQQRQLDELDGQRAAEQARLTALQADAGDLQSAERTRDALREQEIVANRKVGAVQQKVAVLDDQRARRVDLLAERAELSLRIQRLQLLEKACGRDGVQALLIERALPQIEDHANQLLEQLTGGTMHITFNTQRQLRTRDAVAETLDITISDAGGDRPYENYSGGEQFRINFAIRLALSRVLAQRSGARLQTLVIDEGFGSQDPMGRQRLIEAINTIQKDFERILVITHIDELRDAFPTRIEVYKGEDGSHVRVV